MNMLADEREYFSKVILPFHGRMYAAALAITGSADDAADAVQTAMMHVWEGIAKRKFDIFGVINSNNSTLELFSH